MPAEYPEPLRDLIGQLRRMPGIGPRSAERLALWILGQPAEHGSPVAAAIEVAIRNIVPCSRCGFFTESDRCPICDDPGRVRPALCVVEWPTDILPIERTGAFKGLYHALGGRIAPLDHVGPEDLRIAELVRRVEGGVVEEVILALGTDVEGEATARYLAPLLAPSGVRVTRIAQGLPAGGGLESADALTLSRALEGRRAV
jgi:recombination protein RecR